jgi:membrane protein implicated in regulation of membrane protease activity
MKVLPSVLGVILILFGLVLLIVNLSVTNHGLPTAGAIVTLLAGSLTLLGLCWRSSPEETDPRDGEPMIDVGSKLTVLGFGEEGTVQVVPVQRDYHGRSLDPKD